MTIHEDIQKIIDWIKVEEWKEVLNKKQSSLRSGTSTQVPIGPFPDWYWQSLKNQLTEPKAKDLVDRIKALSDIVVEQKERINQLLWLLGYEGQQPDFEGILNPSPHKPGEEKIYWTKLEEKLKEARDDGKWWGLEGLIDITVKVKKHLGISDDELNELTDGADLAMPTKQVGGINTSLTLKETIKICNTLLPHLTPNRILDKLIDEANRYQDLNVIANDIIREKGEIDKGKLEKLKNNQEKHTDYDAIKNELNKIKNLLGINLTVPLPSNWIDQVAKKSELDAVRNDLNKWTVKFPNKKPEQVEAELKKTTGTGVDPSALQKLTGKVQSQQELINKMAKALRETGMLTAELKNQIEVVSKQ